MQIDAQQSNRMRLQNGHRKWRRVCNGYLALLACLILLLLPTGCAEEEVRTARLVLLYVPCAVNADYLQPYNQNVSYTPNLAAFARESTVFIRHQTEAGQSGVAYSAIFSGLHSDGHGVFSHPVLIPDRNYLITEAFADLGYETFYWGGQLMVPPHLGYAQGVLKENAFNTQLTADDPRFAKIIEKLRADPSYRAMVVVNFTVTHAPYNPKLAGEFCSRFPGDCAGLAKNGETPQQAVNRSFRIYLPNARYLEGDYPRTVERLGLSPEQIGNMSRAIDVVYRSLVNHLDQLFGEVLDAIGRAGLEDDSLLVFTADHGEAMYRDNTLFKWGHGWQLAPEVLRVPLIIRWPGASKIPRYEAVTRSIDIYPTLVGLVGASLPDPYRGQLAGEDLSSALKEGKPRQGLLAYSHTVVLHRSVRNLIGDLDLWKRYHRDVDVAEPWVSVRRGDTVFKYRNLDGDHWGFEVFDLAADPEERRNLYDPADPDHRVMGKRLLEYRERLLNAWSTSTGKPVLDDQSQRALRSLGYIE